MGTRGPLPNPRSRRTAERLPAPVVALPVAQPPPAPDGLAEHGTAVWKVCWSLSWMQASDAAAVEHLARLEDERSAFLGAIGADYALEKPVVTPKGEVAGTEVYAHPLIKELRRLDTTITALRDRLGLTPAARARLGLTVIEAETANERLKRLRESRPPASRTDPRLKA